MITKDDIEIVIEELIAKLKSSTTYSVEDTEKLKNALIVRDYLDKKEIDGNFIIVGNEKHILSSMTINYRDNSLPNIADRLCSKPFNVIFLTNNKFYLTNYLVYIIPWYELKGGKTLQTGVQLLFSNSINPSVCFAKVLYYLDLVEYSSIIDVLDANIDFINEKLSSFKNTCCIGDFLIGVNDFKPEEVAYDPTIKDKISFYINEKEK